MTPFTLSGDTDRAVAITLKNHLQYSLSVHQAVINVCLTPPKSVSICEKVVKLVCHRDIFKMFLTSGSLDLCCELFLVHTGVDISSQTCQLEQTVSGNGGPNSRAVYIHRLLTRSCTF